MPTLRLTHPTRETLQFRQTQRDEFSREAVASVTAELGVDRTALVHTETRESTRDIRGRVTGQRRAANDPSVGDGEWRQALANYVDTLESHVDEYQGDGYTLVDDILDVDRQAILESIGWEMTPGQPYEVQYTATVQVGTGTFEERPIQRRTPTVNDALPTMLRVDGIACPGMRSYQVDRSVGVEPTAVFDRDNAENNDIVAQAGVTQQVTFEGTHTGPRAERRTADAALDALAGTRENVTLETYFPGYELDGYLVAYDSNFQASYGTGRHNYRLEFVEGERA
jgi:hypothetical protein